MWDSAFKEDVKNFQLQNANLDLRFPPKYTYTGHMCFGMFVDGILFMASGDFTVVESVIDNKPEGFKANCKPFPGFVDEGYQGQKCDIS